MIASSTRTFVWWVVDTTGRGATSGRSSTSSASRTSVQANERYFHARLELGEGEPAGAEVLAQLGDHGVPVDRADQDRAPRKPPLRLTCCAHRAFSRPLPRIIPQPGTFGESFGADKPPRDPGLRRLQSAGADR